MSKFNKISIILDEGPIARAYLNYFLINNSLSNKIIYLVKKSLFPDKLVLYFKFKKNYFYPLKYLKDKNIIYLIEQVEEFFNFKKNFLPSSYKFPVFKNFSFLIS